MASHITVMAMQRYIENIIYLDKINDTQLNTERESDHSSLMGSN
jgi:hypothetical protein